MRVANVAGRAALLTPAGWTDVERASGGLFPADPQELFERWDHFRQWAATAPPGHDVELAPSALRSPVPRPRQVLAIGLNYRDHADESGFSVPEHPPVFTKFVSSITGPYGDISLPEGSVDWEVELVAVIGRRAWQVGAGQAWDHVAGLTVGQDISERDKQLSGPVPQFSLGKSHPDFAPMGPYLVTPDEFDDPDDLELGCAINGEEMQKGRTSSLIFSVPELIARLSAVLPLLPGDVIFTGTPAGVGLGRRPQRFLAAGEELVSHIEGIGEMRHRMVRG
ncbi:fumarylacetoacetate hydrolase family protein [Streptomyces albipurpureus]|uniref:Fumarylacetoacetate hydrolase family protein n=1 Tax=Streptomyces albipurpureus TaxID=2897419 RepID=A0ABT0UM25_9ACTN|nr:fumarylacetoacetate hydrolase family protein [Streptomyces sp. CWNU-1]MCM2389674.1 fumarylacetoacetate hydrolase family protein [Streptomyces sp. CWNU-1]